MEGIYSTSVTPKTLDESPMAYKSIDDILENIGDTVTVKAVLKPIYNLNRNTKKLFKTHPNHLPSETGVLSSG
ncbi:hypothetical protein ACR6HW_17100 [Fusibacter sp. JL298sf-3]